MTRSTTTYRALAFGLLLPLLAAALVLLAPAPQAEAASCWSYSVSTNWVQRKITVRNSCPINIVVTWKKTSSLRNCYFVGRNSTKTFTVARWSEYAGVRAC